MRRMNYRKFLIYLNRIDEEKREIGLEPEKEKMLQIALDIAFLEIKRRRKDSPNRWRLLEALLCYGYLKEKAAEEIIHCCSQRINNNGNDEIWNNRCIEALNFVVRYLFYMGRDRKREEIVEKTRKLLKKFERLEKEATNERR